MGKFIVFEGPDKVGKETQSKLLEKVLNEEGVKTIRLEPTKQSHPWGKKAIYGMLQSGAAKRYPNLFQVVQFLNRVYFQLFKLPKLRKTHDLVILDRWALSGYVYGSCEGVNPTLNRLMYTSATRPDLVLVLTGTSYRREAADDSYEKDRSLQSKVRAMYRHVAYAYAGHVNVDNHDSVEDVNRSIVATLELLDLVPSPCPVCHAKRNERCDSDLHS